MSRDVRVGRVTHCLRLLRLMSPPERRELIKLILSIWRVR